MNMKIKPYENYKEIDLPWLEEIPSEWKIEKIKYLFDERNTRDKPDEPLLVASQRHGVILRTMYETRTVEAQRNLENLKVVKKGDFVISLRSFQGGIEYAYYDGIISPAYTIIIPGNSIHPGYFKYLAKSLNFIELLKMCVTGIREGQNIDYNKLKNSKMPVPDYKEQKHLAFFLDNKLEKINRFIDLKTRQIELLKEQKEAMINKAVTKGLDDNVEMKDSGIEEVGEIPESWKILSLKRVTRNVKTGSTPSSFKEKHLSDFGLNWYSPGDFKDEVILGSATRKLSKIGQEGVNLFPGGSILIIGIGGTLGKVAISEKEFTCNQQINTIVVNDNIINNYLKGINETDKALRKLVDYFENQDEPVVLVFFGDHNPWLGDENKGYKMLNIDMGLEDEESFKNYYTTPYVFWANDKAKEVLDNDFNKQGEEISPNFLMTELFENLNYTGDEYMQYSKDLKNNYFTVNNDMFFRQPDGTYTRQLEGEKYKVWREFNSVQYYHGRNFKYEYLK